MHYKLSSCKHLNCEIITYFYFCLKRSHSDHCKTETFDGSELLFFCPKHPCFEATFFVCQVRLWSETVSTLFNIISHLCVIRGHILKHQNIVLDWEHGFSSRPEPHQKPDTKTTFKNISALSFSWLACEAVVVSHVMPDTKTTFKNISSLSFSWLACARLPLYQMPDAKTTFKNIPWLACARLPLLWRKSQRCWRPTRRGRR